MSDMTDDELAASLFEPWTHKPEEWTPKSDLTWESMSPHLTAISAGWHMMFKTKSELVEVAGRLVDADIMITTIEQLDDAAKWLSALSTIVTGAQARLIVATMNVEDCNEH